jgi:predicted enzyme related to lactoylglutathione lyase
MQTYLRASVGSAALLALSGCAASVSVPPLTSVPTGSYRPGAFVWFDLLAHDRAAVERFYGELFGWEFDDGGEADPDYVSVIHRGRPIAGIALIDRLEDDILREPRDLDARGRIAVIQDTEGALLGLVRATGGDPEEMRPEPGEWLWTELWTHDADLAGRFYAEVIGYERGTVDEPGLPSDYEVFRIDGEPQAGLIILPEQRIRAHWLPYVRVEDPGPIAARVEELGGRVLIAPSPDIRNGTVALIADPGGAPLVIQQWPIPGMEGGQR